MTWSLRLLFFSVKVVRHRKWIYICGKCGALSIPVGAFSFAPPGLVIFRECPTHGLRRGLHSFAASRLRVVLASRLRVAPALRLRVVPACGFELYPLRGFELCPLRGLELCPLAALISHVAASSCFTRRDWNCLTSSPLHSLSSSPLGSLTSSLLTLTLAEFTRRASLPWRTSGAGAC